MRGLQESNSTPSARQAPTDTRALLSGAMDQASTGTVSAAVTHVHGCHANTFRWLNLDLNFSLSYILFRQQRLIFGVSTDVSSAVWGDLRPLWRTKQWDTGLTGNPGEAEGSRMGCCRVAQAALGASSQAGVLSCSWNAQSLRATCRKDQGQCETLKRRYMDSHVEMCTWQRGCCVSSGASSPWG